MAAAVGDIFEVRIKSHVNAQQCRTILHYRVAVASVLPNPGPEETALFGALTVGPTAILAKYLACCSPDLTVDGIDIQQIQTVRYTNVQDPLIGAVGTFAGASDAQNVSAVLTKSTRFARRSNIGSIHLPGLSKSSYVAGLITNPMKTAMVTLAAALLNPQAPALGGGVYTPVIYHPPKPAEVGPPPVPAVPFGSNEIIAIVPQDTLRVMRRRTVGLGI